MKFKNILIAIFLLLVTGFSYTYFYKSVHSEENIMINSKIDYSLYKNKLLDELLNLFQEVFEKTKYDISAFNHQEVDSKFYFYSQIFNYKEAYFLIEYDEFEVRKLELNFSNIDAKNMDDVVEIISLLIQVSDEDIVKKEARRIAINIMQQLENDSFSTSLVYKNNLIYTITLSSDNTIIFTIS